MSKKWGIVSGDSTFEQFLEQAGERPLRPKSFLNDLFYDCALCVGGNVAGHIVGCIIVPFTLTALITGASSSIGHNPWIMIGSAGTVNAARFAWWYRKRGRFVKKAVVSFNTAITVGGMLVATKIGMSHMAKMDMGANNNQQMNMSRSHQYYLEYYNNASQDYKDFIQHEMLSRHVTFDQASKDICGGPNLGAPIRSAGTNQSTLKVNGNEFE